MAATIATVNRVIAPTPSASRNAPRPAADAVAQAPKSAWPKAAAISGHAAKADAKAAQAAGTTVTVARVADLANDAGASGPPAADPAKAGLVATFASSDALTTASPTIFAGDLIIESRREGKNPHLYRETAGSWADSPSTSTNSKSTATGLSASSQCGSRRVVVATKDEQAGTTEGCARFTLNLAAPAHGFLYVTWPEAANVSPVLAVVHHADGSDTVTLAQNGSGLEGAPNGNAWVPLGEYSFEAGRNQYVELQLGQRPAAPDPRADTQFYADAIRLTAKALPDEETTASQEAADAEMIESAREAARKGLEQNYGAFVIPPSPSGTRWQQPDRWIAYYCRFAAKEGTISGRVLDLEGKPATDASVWARLQFEVGSMRYGQSLPITRTGTEGRFLFPSVALGPYSLGVQKPDHIPIGGKTVLLSDKQPSATAELGIRKADVIAGTVLGDEEHPIAGVRVVVCGQEGLYGGQENMCSITDDAGRFQIQGDRDCKYNLRVEPRSDYARQIVYDVPLGTKDLIINLKRGGSVSGRVVHVDDAGETRPVSGAHVFAGSTCGAYAYLAQVPHVLTDADGQFLFANLCTEEGCEFGIGVDGTSTPKSRPRAWDITCQSTRLQVTPKETENLQGIELLVSDTEPWAAKQWTVSGTVLDACTSKPIQNYIMKTQEVINGSPAKYWRSGGRPVTGKYRQTWEPYRSMQFMVEADGYQPLASPVFHPRKAEQSYDFVLAPVAGIMGVVSQPGKSPRPGRLLCRCLYLSPLKILMRGRAEEQIQNIATGQ